MIFSELYGAYYNVVAAILRKAVKEPVSREKIAEIIRENAFGESNMNIEPALRKGEWQLLHSNGTTELQHEPTMPLTVLEKRWLKAIFEDPRIKLFTGEEINIHDVDPLFKQEDVYIFDRYADGDRYETPAYKKKFKIILNALKKEKPLNINMQTGTERRKNMIVIPKQLEYSEKDDKFRLIGICNRQMQTINLERIQWVEEYDGSVDNFDVITDTNIKTAEFKLYDQRNALERVLLHFAHFKKEAERLDDTTYRIRVDYDEDDEKEMAIRMLSFGPVIKVTAPESLVNKIKDKLNKQKSCGI